MAAADRDMFLFCIRLLLVSLRNKFFEDMYDLRHGRAIRQLCARGCPVLLDREQCPSVEGLFDLTFGRLVFHAGAHFAGTGDFR